MKHFTVNAISAACGIGPEIIAAYFEKHGTETRRLYAGDVLAFLQAVKRKPTGGKAAADQVESVRAMLKGIE